MTRLSQGLLAVMVLAFGACGYSDAGEGTGTLMAVGSLDCAYPSQLTAVRLVLKRELEGVVDANVTLQDADSRETLHVPYDAITAAYSATWPGYHRRVTWQIWSGADGLMARLEGPSRHTIAHPHTGAVLRAQDNLDIRWATLDGVRAGQVTVQVSAESGNLLSQTMNHDSGQHQVAATALSAGQNTLIVQRKDQVVPLGATEGSMLSSSYSVQAGLLLQ